MAITTSLLLYDIPETSEFPNPSAELRQHALRINKSCWVVDNDRTPWGMLNGMTAGNVLWHLIPFAPEATQDILNIAATVMRKDLDDNKQREQESIDRANAALAEVTGNPESSWRETYDARAKHEKAMKTIRKRTEKVVTDLQNAARRFGLDFNNLPVRIPTPACYTQRSGQRVAGVEGMRALNQARAEAITAAAPVVSMEENTPPLIMADALDERNEGTGESLRSLYNDNGTHTNGDTTEVQSDIRPIVSSTQDKIPEPVRQLATPPPIEESRREAVAYTVRTHTSTRRRVSTLTDREAAEELYNSSDSFAASLAGRVMRGTPLSISQRAWLHVLAVEARERRGVGNPPIETTPVTSTPVNSTPVTTKSSNGYTEGVPVIGTRDMDYNETTKRLRVEASKIGWPKLVTACKGVPTRLDVQSHKTSNIKRFSLVDVVANQAEYEADDKTTLLIHSI